MSIIATSIMMQTRPTCHMYYKKKHEQHICDDVHLALPSRCPLWLRAPSAAVVVVVVVVAVVVALVIVFAVVVVVVAMDIAVVAIVIAVVDYELHGVPHLMPSNQILGG